MLGQGGTLSSLTSHKDEEGREGSGLRPLAQGEAGRRGQAYYECGRKGARTGCISTSIR
ncbi:hypothetical protein ALC53_08848 [Atta colombica]|uniref:Uncharacterized protein n=1 Tax=Atta colombica TaxID=520822 RepID=A0A195B905_9HYME|nr:hypothetical protein ALC53_08848 [Atta colombica]